MPKLSPIYATSLKMGAILGEHGGWHVAQRFSGGEGEKAAARERVALADLSYMGRLLLEGQEAGSLLKVIWNAPSLAVNQGAMIGPGTVYSLRRDLVFISLAPGAEGPAIDALEEQAAKLNIFVTVTHMTHAWLELLLIGPASAELLSRLCGLNFHPDHFQNLTARQSSVAKTSQLIVRQDRESIPAYSLIGGRSYAPYLWKTILETGRDLDIRPIGQEALTGLTSR